MNFRMKSGIHFQTSHHSSVVVNAKNGAIFYFNKDAYEFFHFFAEGAPLQSFAEKMLWQDSDAKEKDAYLQRFVRLLVENEIAEFSAEASGSGPATTAKFPRPVFLRKAVYRAEEAQMSLPSFPLATPQCPG